MLVSVRSHTVQARLSCYFRDYEICQERNTNLSRLNSRRILQIRGRNKRRRYRISLCRFICNFTSFRFNFHTRVNGFLPLPSTLKLRLLVGSHWTVYLLLMKWCFSIVERKSEWIMTHISSAKHRITCFLSQKRVRLLPWYEPADRQRNMCGCGGGCRCHAFCWICACLIRTITA